MPGPGPQWGGGEPPDQLRGRWHLRRSVRDRRLKGVAGGVAAAADLDPTLVRLLFAVAALSGWGIVAYIALAVVLQDETQDDPARPLPRDQRRPLRIGLGVAAVVAVARLFDGLFFPGGDAGLPFLLIAVGAAVLWARRDQTPTAAVGTPPGGPEDGWSYPAPPTAAGPWPTGAAAPPLDAGVDWRSTGRDLLRLAAAFVAVGALLAIVAGAFLVVVGAVPMRLPFLPAAVGIAGLLILVVAVVRKARAASLLVSGGVLVAAAALAVSLASFPGGPAGTQIVVVGPDAPLLDRYEHSAGRLVLDLGQLALEPGSQRRVVAEVGTGQLTVIVPPALTTKVRSHVGAGSANLFGREHGGPGIDVTGRHDGTADGDLDLDLDVGLGQIQVELAPEPTFEVTCAVPAAAKGDGTDPVTCPHPTRLASTAMTCSVNLIAADGGTGDGRAFCRRQGSVPAIGRFAATCAVSAEGQASCAPLAPPRLAELGVVRRGPQPPASVPVGAAAPLTCGPPDAAGERTCTATPAPTTSTTVPVAYRCREEPATGQLTCVPA